MPPFPPPTAPQRGLPHHHLTFYPSPMAYPHLEDCIDTRGWNDPRGSKEGGSHPLAF